MKISSSLLLEIIKNASEFMKALGGLAKEIGFLIGMLMAFEKVVDKRKATRTGRLSSPKTRRR